MIAIGEKNCAMEKALYGGEVKWKTNKKCLNLKTMKTQNQKGNMNVY
jgi:hypothetical protein